MMAPQLELNFHRDKRSHEERFADFHRQNPHVYDDLVRLAREAKAAGKTKLGIRAIWEIMRWENEVRTRRAEGEFKLNDHMTRFYARKIMKENPDLDGLFETRERKG